MRNKYKIYSVILTGIILTGCKSVRMTSQDRQQFMPNGISVAQQLLEETEEATQAKSPEAIKTTPSANNTTSESSVEESSMKESNQSQDEQENNVNILALEIEPYELSDVCNAIFEKSLDEVEQSQNQYGMYYLTDGDRRVRQYDMLGLEYEVKGVSGSYSAIAEMATSTLRWQEILLRESFPQDKIDSEMKPEDAEKICREIAEKIGYSYTYVRTYAMDLQSIKKINKNAEDSVSGPGYENKEDEYDGTWSGVFTGGKPWTQEDEAYLVIMKNPLINGRILENNGNSDIAWMVYHPVKGLLYMKIPPRYRICSEQKKNLIPLHAIFIFVKNQASSIMHTAQDIEQAIRAEANPDKVKTLSGFFKTGKGQYGEGDKFLGVVVPNTRIVAKRHKDIPFEVMAELLQSEWHECRLCALLMMVERFKKSDEKEREAIYRFYLSQTERINNWDLVDLSAPYIVGEYLRDKSRDDLYRLAESKLLWEQRIAVVATVTLIRNNDFTDILRLAELLLQHKHDLMQKAIGWMLREMGKKDRDLLLRFLDKYRMVMPRTMLRYSIEKLTEAERKYYMKR